MIIEKIKRKILSYIVYLMTVKIDQNDNYIGLHKK